MKKFACRLSIILPLSTIFMVLMETPTLTIPQIGLYLDWLDVLFLYITVSILWLCCSPFRKSCCVGDGAEVLFNLVPVEVISVICFAQYHFAAAIIFLSVMTAIEYVTVRTMRQEERQHEFSKRRHRSYTFGLQRGAVLISAAVFAIPCFLSLFVYELKSPEYTAQERSREQLFGDKNDENQEAEKAGKEPDPYLENKTLLRYLDDSAWKRLDIQERITVAQEFADFQSGLLGIPTVPITAEKLGPFTLGEYSNESNEIWVDVEHLAKSSVEEFIQTLCHEIYHSGQYYLITNIDWNQEVFQSAYFKELREWEENDKNYQHPYLHGYDAYISQPLEASAKAYSVEETSKIISYIHLLEEEE